jgi:hypothetical protein
LAREGRWNTWKTPVCPAAMLCCYLSAQLGNTSYACPQQFAPQRQPALTLDWIFPYFLTVQQACAHVSHDKGHACWEPDEAFIYISQSYG